MRTSTAAIQDLIDAPVPGFAFGAASRAPCDGQEGIVVWIANRRIRERFESGSGLAPVREYQLFAFGNTAQDALGIFPEFEYGHGLR